MLLVKKYPNRRLYDTRNSRYITLAELERLVREGSDVAVQDAQDGRDLTQETLTQIILERNGGRILPTSLLTRLIRLDDVALAEFLTRYVGWALEVYVGAKQRAKTLLPINPLATAPFTATDALARLVLGAAQWGRGGEAGPPMPPTPMPEPPVPPSPPMSIDEIGNREAIADFIDAVSPPEPIATEDTLPRRVAAAGSVAAAEELRNLRAELEAIKSSLGTAAGRKTKTAAKKKSKKKSSKR